MKNIEIGSKEYKIVKKFPVLYEGWDSDNTGYIAKRDGKAYLIMSSHGRFFVAKQKELEGKVEEYKIALKESKEALRMLYKGEDDE